MQQINKSINYLNFLSVLALALNALIANIGIFKGVSSFFATGRVDLFELSLALFSLATISNFFSKEWPRIYFVALVLLLVPIVIFFMIGFLSGAMGYRS